MKQQFFDKTCPLTRSRTLRGGRLTKWKGKVASIAHIVGVATAFSGLYVGTASAANECGTPTYPNAQVTCDAATFTVGPDSAVIYQNADGLALTLDDVTISPNDPGLDGAVVVFGDANSTNTNTISLLDGTLITSSGAFVHGLWNFHEGTGDASVDLAGGSITSTGIGVWVTTENTNSAALMSASLSSGRIESLNSSAIVVANEGEGAGLGRSQFEMTGGEVVASGGGAGVTLFAYGDVDALISGGSIIARGDGLALTSVEGNATVRMEAGYIESTQLGGTPIRAEVGSGFGDATVTITGGTIVGGDGGFGSVRARNEGEGDARIFMDGGEVFGPGGTDGVGLMATSSGLNSTTEVIMTDGLIDMRDGDFRKFGIISLANGGGDARALVLGGSILNDRPGANGVRVGANGGGDAYVEIDAVVQGGSIETIGSLSSLDFAVDTSTFDFSGLGSAGLSTVVVGQNANISALSNMAIYNNEGASLVIINDGASVTGEIHLNDGSDEVTVIGSGISGITVMNGGDGVSIADGYVDALRFQDLQNVDLMGANLLGWEKVIVDGGSLSFSDNLLETGSDEGMGLIISNAGILNAQNGLMLTGNLTNNSIVSMQDGMDGDMITVSNDYTGGGVLLLDANTATTTGDTLVINGDVLSGVTTVLAQSTTPNALLSSDLVAVTVDGTSVEGDFIGALTSGAFDYSLVKSGNDFVFSAASQAVNSTGAAYETAPSVLGAFNRLPTLEQRVGQRQWAGQSAARAKGKPITGGWLRFTGDKLDATTTTGSSIASKTWGLQTGADFAVEPGDAGQWVLGVTGQYGKMSSTVTSALGFGTIDAEGFGVGATATWYGNTGTYVDLQGQVNWIDSDISSSAAGSLVKGQSAKAYALSAEVGHRFALNETAALVPQAQLTWGRIDGGAFTDSAGNAVDFGSNDRTIGRLGLAYEYAPKTAAGGNPTKAYVIGNILHDFSGDSSVKVGGASLSTGAAEKTWGEIGVGGSYAMDANKTLYGEAAYRTSFGGSSNNNGLSATVGLRIQW